VAVVGFDPTVKERFVAELAAAGVDVVAPPNKELVDLRLLLNCHGDECECMAMAGREIPSEWVLWGDVVGGGAKAHLVSVETPSMCRHTSFELSPLAPHVRDAWSRLNAR
jgi:hypothetical protein